MQLPTTLPTLDEILGRDGINPDNAHEKILQLSGKPAPAGHVYTVHAELEGMKLIGILETLLLAWKHSGRVFLTLGELHEAAKHQGVPTKPIVWGKIAGRSGLLAMEGAGP